MNVTTIDARGNWDFELIAAASLGNDMFQALKQHASKEEVGKLLNQGVKITSETLNVALQYQNSIELIHFLIDAGAKPTHADLMTALEKRSSVAIIELLVAKNIDRLSEYALLNALKYNNSYEVIKLLIDKRIPCSSYCLIEAQQKKLSKEIVELVERANIEYQKALDIYREKQKVIYEVYYV